MSQPKKASRGRTPANPLDLLLLTRDRLQEVIDDAVARGRMTRDDATELVAELVRRSRNTSEAVVGDLEQLLGRSREEVSRRTRRTTQPDAGFPIDDYDELTAAEVNDRLGDLTPAQLRKVRDHERRNANRKTVLTAVEKLLS